MGRCEFRPRYHAGGQPPTKDSDPFTVRLGLLGSPKRCPPKAEVTRPIEARPSGGADVEFAVRSDAQKQYEDDADALAGRPDPHLRIRLPSIDGLGTPYGPYCH